MSHRCQWVTSILIFTFILVWSSTAIDNKQNSPTVGLSEEEFFVWVTFYHHNNTKSVKWDRRRHWGWFHEGRFEWNIITSLSKEFVLPAAASLSFPLFPDLIFSLAVHVSLFLLQSLCLLACEKYDASVKLINFWLVDSWPPGFAAKKDYCEPQFNFISSPTSTIVLMDFTLCTTQRPLYLDPQSWKTAPKKMNRGKRQKPQEGMETVDGQTSKGCCLFR